jgi:RNA polymerase primary sigma factor
MARANLRLVVNVARTYQGKGLPLEDLIAEGNLGLMRAVEAVDPEMSTRFSTYACFWIRQSIRRALNMTGRAVRLPHYAVGLVGRWRDAAAILRKELGRVPTADEVATRLGLGPRQVRVVESALRVYASGQVADSPDDGPGPAEQVADYRAATPDEQLAGSEELGVLRESIGRLSERDAAVVRLRFGLDGSEPRTLQEVGNQLGYTRERVRQIERDALAKLRGAVRPD